MNKESFDELVESIKEGGAILRRERKPSRVFKYPSKDSMPAAQVTGILLGRDEQEGKPKRDEVFAICVATDDPELLHVRKIYWVRLLSNNLLSLIDETGEAAIYPIEQFILIELPREVEEALSKVA